MYVSFLILDPSGHNLPGSHPPLARIMQITTAEHLFWAASSVWIGRNDVHGWYPQKRKNIFLRLKMRIWGEKWVSSCSRNSLPGCGLLAGSDTLSGFLWGGWRAGSCRSASPVSLPSLHQPHSFHRADSQMNVFGSLKVVLETHLVL